MGNNINKFLEIQDSLHKDNEQRKEIKDKFTKLGTKSHLSADNLKRV